MTEFKQGRDMRGLGGVMETGFKSGVYLRFVDNISIPTNVIRFDRI